MALARFQHRDPFQHSMLGRAAFERLVIVVGVLAVLWLAIVWAIAIP